MYYNRNRQLPRATSLPTCLASMTWTGATSTRSSWPRAAMMPPSSSGTSAPLRIQWAPSRRAHNRYGGRGTMWAEVNSYCVKYYMWQSCVFINFAWTSPTNTVDMHTSCISLNFHASRKKLLIILWYAHCSKYMYTILCRSWGLFH